MAAFGLHGCAGWATIPLEVVVFLKGNIMATAFDQKLKAVRMRYGINILLEQAGLALAGAGLAAALAVLIERLLAIGLVNRWTMLGLLGLVLVVTATLWILRRPTPMQAALMIDERLALRERFSTALVLSKSNDPFAVAASEEAHSAANRVSLRGQFPIQLSRRWYYTSGAWLLAGAILAFMPGMDLLGNTVHKKQDQQQVASLQKARTDVQLATSQVKTAVDKLSPDLAADLAKVGDMSNPGEKPAEVRRNAIQKLTDLADKVKQMQAGEKMESTKATQDMMRGLRALPEGPMKDISRAMAKGDFTKAASEMRELQRQLSEGKLTEEQKKQLAKQLEQLSQQMQGLANQQKQLEDALQKAGLDKALAKATPEQMKEAMQKQGLSQEQMDSLMQKAAACKSASSACKNLASAMASAGAGGKDGQLSAEELDGLAEQLDKLELDKQQLDMAAATLAQISQAVACLGQGQGQGQGMQGPWQPGDPAGRSGSGTGAPGQGYGPRDSDDSGETANVAKKVKSDGQGGPTIASWYIKGEHVKGEARRELSDVIQAAKDSADAVSENDIPRKYEGPVKKYFGDLMTTAEEESAPSK